MYDNLSPYYIWIYLKYSQQNKSLGSCGDENSEELHYVYCHYCWFCTDDIRNLQIYMSMKLLLLTQYYS